jgi:hypothetical protein
MARTAVTHRYLRVSEARDRLMDGMFGGLHRPEPVNLIMKLAPRVSIRFHRWAEIAGAELRKAATQGDLVIYIANLEDLRSPEALPPALIGSFIRSHGGLPDRPIRPNARWIADGLVAADTFNRLQHGVLVVDEQEFKKWYRTQRKGGRWHSQATKRRKGPGHSSKQAAWRDRIVGSCNAGEWNAAQGVPALRRQLTQRYSDVPSEDSLRRHVSYLFDQSGDSRLRPRRRPKRRMRALKSQN